MQLEKLNECYANIKDKSIDDIRVTEAMLGECKEAWDKKFDYMTTLTIGMEESAEFIQNLSKVLRNKYAVNSIAFLEEVADIELSLEMIKRVTNLDSDMLERVKYIKAQRIINEAL